MPPGNFGSHISDANGLEQRFTLIQTTLSQIFGASFDRFLAPLAPLPAPCAPCATCATRLARASGLKSFGQSFGPFKVQVCAGKQTEID